MEEPRLPFGKNLRGHARGKIGKRPGKKWESFLDLGERAF